MPQSLFGAARFTVQYVRSVGQGVSLGKCVLLSSSERVKKKMKLWDVSGDGQPGKVELGIWDLGGHLDFTRRVFFFLKGSRYLTYWPDEVPRIFRA